ncbi:hypothetical protein BKA67DRAFT_546143 [Truncatella angustata]|uniref:Uncharacterized protein n=1 Tax=Truncatella angustata TaxID=152316 RepID=A0A9P8UXB8_9PEZI|nr:uncharacterized protein BKA67DRAFT_546143 [Truncatella angustata]KAH6659895.1 hypothetical protein BKA67DRAFT_546143 [Truncatella angustata]
MSRYDAYDAPVRETRYYREERHRAEPRYEQDYLSVNPASRTQQLIPRVTREDSDLSIEEVRRDFPPPGYASRDVRRTRSAEPGYDDDYYYRRDHDSRSVRDDPRDHRSRKTGSVYYEEEERTRKRVLNKQEQIIAAVVGGVIAAGAKEVWDRREAKEKGHGDVNRNLAASAALAAGGAFAGYQGAEVYNKHAAKEEKKSTYVVHKGRDGRVDERYYSDEEEDPRDKKGNKSFLESALGAAGLGGAIKALTGGGDDHRSEGRSRRGSPDSTRSRGGGGDNANRMQKAAKASLVAGAAEAFRVSREPGGWKGEKMKRILTAAAGAATIDAAQNPDKDSKRHLMESVIGGLVGNRVLNGSRKDIEEDRRTGRSRSRSRARSDGGGGGGGGTGLAALATAGLGALAGKKLLDKKEESRSRSRRGSPDSYYSRDESPRRRQRSRSRSVVDTARRSLAKIGLGSAPADDRSDYGGSRDSRRRRGQSPGDRYDDDYDARGAYMRGGRGDEHDDRSARGGGRRRSRSVGRGSRRSSSVSSSDLGDSDEDEKRAKKMKDRRRRHDR